jgi:hypothetical protein
MESNPPAMGAQVRARDTFFGAGNFRLPAGRWILDDTHRPQSHRPRCSAMAAAVETMAAGAESVKRSIAAKWLNLHLYWYWHALCGLLKRAIGFGPDNDRHGISG